MSGKCRWWSKKAKKEFERRERELAEEKAKGRSDSEDRQEKIKVLWGLDEQQIRAAKNPKERKLKEQKLKAQKLQQLLKSVEDLAGNHDLVDRVSELIELAGSQDREIEYLMKFRRDWEQIEAHYPDRLENLYTASLFGPFDAFMEKLLSEQKPKNFEDTRRRYKLSSGVGLIENEFGGAGEAEWRKHSLSGPLGLPYQPTCLDKIFAGGAVKMHESEGERMDFWSPGHRIREPGLQNLFGMHRNRFPKNLPVKEDGREIWYDYRAAVKIMHRLLSEKPRESESPTRGRTRQPWPSNPSLRIRVLTGIVARMESLSVSQAIWGAFMAVACHHLGIGETTRTKHLKEKVAALIRRYLPDSAKK
jgi:hypothetical protein